MYRRMRRVTMDINCGKRNEQQFFDLSHTFPPIVYSSLSKRYNFGINISWRRIGESLFTKYLTSRKKKQLGACAPLVSYAHTFIYIALKWRTKIPVWSGVIGQRIWKLFSREKALQPVWNPQRSSIPLKLKFSKTHFVIN